MTAPERSFELWRLLPAHLRRSDERGDLQAFIGVLQDVVDRLLAEGDRWLDIIDLRWAPEPYLELILADLGNPFPFVLDLAGKRRLASALLAMYRLKGTAVGIERALWFFASLRAQGVSHTSTAARLGRARLDRDFRLGSSARFDRYAFDVIVDRVLTDEERRQVRWLIDYLKPAHTHLARLREPMSPPVPVVWHLGHGWLARTTRLVGS